jgi:hypothetical protein
MARKLKTKKGRAVYSRRKTIVEPVFGQIDTVQDARQLLLRGKQAAREHWRFHCAIHNLLKLHRAGGLDLIGERHVPSRSPSATRAHPLRRSRQPATPSPRASGVRPHPRRPPRPARSNSCYRPRLLAER